MYPPVTPSQTPRSATAQNTTITPLAIVIQASRLRGTHTPHIHVERGPCDDVRPGGYSGDALDSDYLRGQVAGRQGSRRHAGSRPACPSSTGPPLTSYFRTVCRVSSLARRCPTNFQARACHHRVGPPVSAKHIQPTPTTHPWTSMGIRSSSA